MGEIDLKGVNVRLIVIEHGGPAKARNIGIKNANGEVVLFIDADCVADPTWLKTIVKRVERGDVAGAGGIYVTRNPENWIANFIGADIEYRYLNMGAYTDFVGSYSACFKKDVILEVGGFDEDFKEASAEDNDLCYRIVERGYKLACEPNARVMHSHPSTLQKFIRQQFKRAMWRILLYKKNIRWVRGDKYAKANTLIQPIILAMSFLGLIFGLIYAHLSMLPIVALMAGVTFLIALNFDFLQWIYRRNGSIAFTLFSLLMIFLRNAIWCLGACYGLIRFLPKRVKRAHVNAWAFTRKTPCLNNPLRVFS
jgi:cellulose synthase/poly-beta-1,6-N-acetylglucosamine synthase-like glycosyltransferase